MSYLGEVKEDVQGLRDDVKRLLAGSGINNVNTQKIDAGPAGLWVAATCCLVMLAILITGMVVGGLWVSREFTRYDVALSERKEENDRSQTYLSSIYGRMPQWMREEVEKEASSKQAAKEKKNAQ